LEVILCTACPLCETRNIHALDARERAKFAGFQKKFENPVFIKNLAIMLELSLALQKADITLPILRSAFLLENWKFFSAR